MNVLVGWPQSFDGVNRVVEGAAFALSFDRAPRRMTWRKATYRIMYYIYILLLSNKQVYTGFTATLRKRIQQHKVGSVKSTKLRRPVKLIHYEAYLKESDARRREKYLKTTEGKRFLKQQIRDLLDDL